MLATVAVTPRPPLCAREPQEPVLRAGLVAVRWKRGNPYADRTALRVSQRFAFGLAKPVVARAEGTDEAAIDALLARDGFAELIDSWRDILDESSSEFMARLEKLCRIALTNALEEWDLGAALFAQRELGQGRDPARTLARRVQAQARRVPPPIPAPPLAPRPPGPQTSGPRRDPLDALVQRSAAQLRQAVVLEQAIVTEAQQVEPRGVAATVAAARRALARKRAMLATAAHHPQALPHALPVTVAADPEIGRPSAVADPAATQPRRTRAP